jgi:hypothetical protein
MHTMPGHRRFEVGNGLMLGFHRRQKQDGTTHQH